VAYILCIPELEGFQVTKSSWVNEISGIYCVYGQKPLTSQQTISKCFFGMTVVSVLVSVEFYIEKI
jgi:hypothetical protein